MSNYKYILKNKMGLVELFGCLLLAFGPPAVMFFLTVSKDPVRIIVLITSAFFWLCSLLFSSLVWYVVSPLRDHLAFAVFFSVLIQEIFRYIFFLVIKKAQKGLAKVQSTLESKNNMHMHFDSKVISYVSGLGFGIICGIFSLVNLLSDMNGPASLGIYGDSQYFYIVSSVLTLCFILLNTLWSINMYLSLLIYEKHSVKFYASIAFVVVSHMFVSLMTLLNDSKNSTSYIYTFWQVSSR